MGVSKESKTMAMVGMALDELNRSQYNPMPDDKKHLFVEETRDSRFRRYASEIRDLTVIPERIPEHDGLFVAYCAKNAGLPHNKSLHSEDWLNLGEEVDIPIWTPTECPRYDTRTGDICVFWRGRSERDYKPGTTTVKANVGIYLSQLNSGIFVVQLNHYNNIQIKHHEKRRILGVRRLEV